MTGGGCVVEKEEPIVSRPGGKCRVTYDECRVTCTTRIVKFNVRTHVGRDRGLISSAVAEELYETARAIIGAARNAGSHCRGACFRDVRAGPVFEIECYVALTADIDKRRASRAHVLEMELPIGHNEGGSIRRSGFDACQ